MSPEVQLLILTAISIAVIHTIAGPDHYLPFIALSKARGWSMRKTISWTLVCGCGHVWSSILLGLVVAAIGYSLSSLKWLESIRGGIAGWMLLGFGIVYTAWGFIRAKNRRHKHFDIYDDGQIYVYEHKNDETVLPKEKHPVTPWVMFLVFVLGPCEPMIPLLYFPAAKSSWIVMLVLILVYTFFTLLIMVAMVVVGYYGFGFFRLNRMEKHIHAISGVTILICGVGVLFMNW